METREIRIEKIMAVLRKTYPGTRIALNYKTAFELLVAVILSAQCTDERVNMVTPSLFRRFPTPRALSQAATLELESIIRSTGFYHSKAKHLIGAARGVTWKFKGQVPDNMADLLTLPGVARKTANVVLGTAFGRAEGLVVDTHVARVSQRLGLTEFEDPEKIEKDLMALVPKTEWIVFSTRMIFHGRKICAARKPLCPECLLNPLCPATDLGTSKGGTA